MLISERANDSIQFMVLREKLSHLFERVVEFTQDVVLIKDFALVAMFIVVVDFLPHVCWKLVEGHVLLHLLVLRRQRKQMHISCCMYTARTPNIRMTVLISNTNKQEHIFINNKALQKCGIHRACICVSVLRTSRALT